MSEHGGKTYRPWEPQRYQHEAHSPASKLPEGDLVFFLLDAVAKLDVSRFYAPYEQETRGAPPFDPAMMVCLLLYAYSVGVFSSRKIALACERNLAFMAIVGEDRPDFRTISDFRKLHLDAFKEVFVQVVRLAGEAGLVKLGNVSTDGTKLQGEGIASQGDELWVYEERSGASSRRHRGVGDARLPAGGCRGCGVRQSSWG